jgi:peptidyl-prolyl cis-trans isomerase C
MGCSVKAAIAGAARVPVTVNGVLITHDAISRETQNHPAPRPIDAWNAAARALAVRELLLQEVRRLGLSPAPIVDGEGRRETDEEALVRGLIETEVATPTPDEASCRRYHERNRARFRSPDIFECSHILFAARREDVQAFATARKRAEAIRAKLRDAPGQFAALAAAHSDCPSGRTGGNLGQVTSGATTPEFERALLDLEAGVISAPVQTRYGWHIIRLDRRIAGALLPFEAVHTRIASYLAERAQRLAMAQYVARLAARAQVHGVELPRPDELRVH